jgi:transposase
MTNLPLIPDDGPAGQVLLLELAARLARREDELVAQKQALASKDQALASKDQALASKDQALAAKDEALATLAGKIERQQQEIVEHKLTINELMRLAFQKRSERYLQDPNQLQLDFGEEAADAAEGLAEAIAEAAPAEPEIVVPEHTRRKRERKTRNEQLPAHLERYEVEAPVPDEMKSCPTHGERKIIGYDVTETLEFVRPKLQVRRTKYPKFACAGSPECGVDQPARPEGLVEGNRFDTSVAAEIVTAKSGYHLPLYRQQDQFASCGWTPSRSTLLNIATAAGNRLPPFLEYLRGEALADGLVGTDDTRVTLLLPAHVPAPIEGDPKSQRIHDVLQAARDEKKPSVTARMWAYRSVTLKLNVFDFTVSRHRDGPDQFLVESGFQGTMLADCYSGYQGIALRSDSRIARAACNAHARRKVYEAQDNHPLLASQLLALYQQLYDVEDRARLFTPADRQQLREQEARPLWGLMREVLDSDAAQRVLPKEKISEALGYLHNHRDALQLYLTDGRLPFDNNEVEQLMKQVAIGRKNWLFLGSVAAGERAANFLTLVSSAVRNDLDVWSYLKAVFDALLAGSTDYPSLRPDLWAAAHPEAIRIYRQEERRHRAESKSTRRNERRRRATSPKHK